MLTILKKPLQPTYHRLWRTAAHRLAPDTRRDWLPGWMALELFVDAWLRSQPHDRSQIVTGFLMPDTSIYLRAIKRAGGPVAAFTLCADSDYQPNPKTWGTDENPNPTLDNVVAALVQIADVAGVPLVTREP